MDNEHKRALEHLSSVLTTSEARLYEQVNSTFNWLLATLFTANGGAVVALLDRQTSTAHARYLPLGLFAAGVVCSIFMGIANAVYAQKAIMPTTELKTTVALVAAGLAPPSDLPDKMASSPAFDWLKWPLYGSGVLSLGCLIGGMIAFAFTM